MRKKGNPDPIGAALEGLAPSLNRPSARYRVEQLSAEILSARSRGWQIEQIAEALNKKFSEYGQTTIHQETFKKYISQMCTRARVSVANESDSTRKLTEHDSVHQQESLTEDKHTSSAVRSLRTPRSNGQM